MRTALDSTLRHVKDDSMSMRNTRLKKQLGIIVMTGAIVWSAGSGTAQTNPQRAGGPAPVNKPAPVPLPSTVPADFVIGPDDMLRIDVVGEALMSGDFLVRPDGKIVMLQVDEILAAGLKPEDLKKKIKQELTRFFQEPVPEVFVQVKAINSRKVHVSGAVNRQGPIPLTGPIRFSQLVSLFGGFQEFADKKKITIISGTQKNAKGEAVTWFINYEDIEKGRNMGKNDILLQPGDTVIVRGG